MKKEFKNSNFKYKTIIWSAVLGIFVTVASMLIFAVIMYLTEVGFQYSSLFATLSVAAGLFIATYYAAFKKKSKGFLTGVLSGGITFLIVLLVSFFTDDGSLSYNTLFHLIIFMLSAIIGGILGVNKASTKKFI